MHRLLARQLKKLKLGDLNSPEVTSWQEFLKHVETSYQASDQDRYTLERSLTISSEEMQAMHKSQKDSYEVRLHSILAAIPDVLFLVTEDCKCIEVMSGSGRLLNEQRDKSLGKYIHEVYTKEQSEFFQNAITQALETEQLVVVNYELDINDSTHHFEGRIKPTDHKVEGKRTVVFVAIDVTKRIKTEVQGQLISTVFESSKEGMIILDNKLRLVTVNISFCEMYDESMESIPETIPSLIKDFMSNETNQQILKAVRKEGHWIGEIAGKYKNGKSYPLWLTINTVKNTLGQVINYVIMLTDISEIKRSREELEHVATHDSLTNLPNRVLFHDRLEQAVKRTQRTNSLGALFFLDLDRFKNINDNLGHQVGDDLIIQVSQRLSTVKRDSDTLARLGGDEFTLIIEGLSKTEELAMIAEKIHVVFNKPFLLGGYKLNISVSIGISVFPRDSGDPDELIKHADTAMYSAKDMGRNTYQFYTQELTSNAFEYFAIEMALRKSLDRKELFLLYQPQYDIKRDEFIGVEALIRWRHPDMGVVSPNMFIPIAETSGQIEEIGEWVIGEVCNQCILWKKDGLPEFPVSVNLSRKQLVIPNFFERVQNILFSKNIDGKRLEFEITESSILENEDVVYNNLKELQKMGITMAIDDFGTGYSSLVNLKQFPLSRLKIDQSFVRDVTKDTNDEAIIRATIALGKSLQLKIIAEGVETEEQRAFLNKEGCDQAQGYLYSEPVSPDKIADLLVAGQRPANKLAD